MAKKRGNGEGSITKRKDGSWMGRVSTGRNDNGTLKRQCVYGRTRAEVAEKLNKVISEVNSGVYIEPSKITLKEWLNTWLWDYKRQSLKPTSFTRYEICARVHIVPVLGQMLLKDLRPFHIQKLINSNNNSQLSSRSIKYIYTTLHNSLDLASRNGLIPINICKAVVLPKQQKKEVRVLSIEEQNKFLQAAKGSRYELAFILDLYTGLRLSELLALKWDYIDFEEGTLRVAGNIQRIKTYNEEGNKTALIYQNTTKTKAGQRTIPLLDELISLLKKHKIKQEEEKEKAVDIYKDSGYVFCNEIGECIEPRKMTVYFNAIAAKIGLGRIKMPAGWTPDKPVLKSFKFPKWFKLPEDWQPGSILPEGFKIPNGINFHSLRHTFATRGLENGINPKVMQEILGHTSITMTLDLYSHVLPDTKKDSINKLKNLFNKTTKKC